jgi:hypothetical protein
MDCVFVTPVPPTRHKGGAPQRQCLAHLWPAVSKGFLAKHKGTVVEQADAKKATIKARPRWECSTAWTSCTWPKARRSST